MKYVLFLAAAAGVALGSNPAVAQCGGQCRSATPIASPMAGCSMVATPATSGMPTTAGMPAATPAPAAPASGHEHHHGMTMPAAPVPAAPAATDTPAASPSPAGGACPKCKTSADASVESKEIRLTGTLVRTKCKHSYCSLAGQLLDAIRVEEAGAVVTYLLADVRTGEAFSTGLAAGTEGVTVTGTVFERDGMKYLRPTRASAKS